MRKELLIGCGSRMDKLFDMHGVEPGWHDLTRLDINSDHNPDVVWDLTKLPLPFEDNTFDEIHAYEVLEHTGSQGDYKFFFAQFDEFYRILKPDGFIIATVPVWNSIWAFGDPSHTRTIQAESLIFLDQSIYTERVGISPMSDFRYIYKSDFKLLDHKTADMTFAFVLQAIKPSRISI